MNLTLFRTLALGALATLLCACTTVGMHTPARSKLDYGPPQTMRVCVLKADGVSQRRQDELIHAVNKELSLYNIQVVVPWTRPWKRNDFTVYGMFGNDLSNRPLEAPCDRLVALSDRNIADFLWQFTMLPEVLGGVDEETHTHGMIVANVATENQLQLSPSAATVHEFYHLLGCPHAATLTHCYQRIADLKRQAQQNPEFFPGVTQDGQFLVTREAVNEVLQVVFAKEQSKRHGSEAHAVALPTSFPGS